MQKILPSRGAENRLYTISPSHGAERYSSLTAHRAYRTTSSAGGTAS